MNCVDCALPTGKAPNAKRCAGCDLAVRRARACASEAKRRATGLVKAADPVKKARSTRAWKLANASRVRARQTAWRRANLETCAAHSRESYERHADKRKASALAWSKANTEAKRVHSLRRRATHDGNLPSAAAVRALRLSESTCAYCLNAPGSCLDHVLPLSRGGSNAPTNLVVACRSCNSRKHNRTPLEFAFGLPRLGLSP
jgi:5-methylcytosine-specific restriction endonuclease McrA